MSVIVEPSEELLFHSPFTRISKESLFVKNPSDKPIIFKVKTTAPKQYCVRPNAGKIEPNSEIEVQIILQPFKEEPTDDYKCKDKFLVQTAPLNESLENQDVTNMWAHIETSDKQSMRQHKIKCVFVGLGSKLSDSIIEEEQTIPTEPIREIAPTETTDAQAPIHNNDVTPALAAPKVSNQAELPSPAVEQTTVAPTQTLPTVVVEDEKKTEEKDNTIDIQLKEALEKVRRLEREIEELKKQNELTRKENSTLSSRKLSPTVQPLDAVHQHLAQLEKPCAVEGYPPQVLFGVSFIVFFFTYLFF
ncbi:PapD-like protein [Sporodiniella umbellata]|nr:PapD-like protein [Sporodiniella umbellata]